MRVIGLMSGTSMDGIDAALIDTDGAYHIERFETASLAYDKDFISDLKKAVISPFEKSENRAILIKKSTEYHAELISQLLIKLNISSKKSKKIDLIGYHGQTLYHNPAEKITLQIGDAQHLANLYQIPVIHDFRAQDMLHGGQGAPLAPLYHQALMVQKKLNNLVFINCGGIANISIISGKKFEDIQGGFDTGPGNILLDKFVAQWTDGEKIMDKDGQFAALGIINTDFLNILYNKTTHNNFYLKSPPKSLDIQDIIYIEEINQYFSKNNIQNLYNGCATLAVFTAKTIAQSIPSNFKHCVISGGGAKNPAILKNLKLFLPKDSVLNTADEMGWSTTYMEAELIAWLAVRSLKKLPLSIPQTTGVKIPLTGGQCAYPQ
jgi:anhydro-N-acetylmuramic acid kinase